MATHSSILAWKIPWTEEPGRLQFMWSQSDTAEVTIVVQSLTWTQHTRLPLLLLFRFSAMSDSLQSHGLQQARLPLSCTICQSFL